MRVVDSLLIRGRPWAGCGRSSSPAPPDSRARQAVLASWFRRHGTRVAERLPRSHSGRALEPPVPVHGVFDEWKRGGGGGGGMSAALSGPRGGVCRSFSHTLLPPWYVANHPSVTAGPVRVLPGAHSFISWEGTHGARVALGPPGLWTQSKEPRVQPGLTVATPSPVGVTMNSFVGTNQFASFL